MYSITSKHLSPYSSSPAAANSVIFFSSKFLQKFIFFPLFRNEALFLFTAAEAMDKAIANADTEVLAEVVKLTQKLGLKGARGGWKDFLNSYDRRFGASLSNPARRSRDCLVSFLGTFERKNHKFIGKLMRRFSNQRAIEQFTNDHQGQESPMQRLVRMTLEHSQYKQNFSFPSLDEEWMVVPLGKLSKAMTSEDMVAIDCEMVGCQDGTEAIVRICAVDQNLRVIFDEKVNPGKAVADYRTNITGIAAEDLEGVTCSLADIKKSLRKLLAHGTILVGHSLHNDLQALKIDHLRVIDTSYIFKIKDLPASYTPSLNNLCKAVLGNEIRKEGEAHNCLNDALAAMKLVLAKLEHGFDDPLVVAMKKVSDSDLVKLLLHKIPLETPCQELRNLFPPEYNIEIQTDSRVRSQFYSTFAIFKDADEADAAFRQIKGQENMDFAGRIQKFASLELGTGQMTHFYVRKMAADGKPNVSDLPNKRSVVEDDKQDSKRQRMSLHQCEHAEEIEALKQTIRDREEEIFNLQLTLSYICN